MATDRYRELCAAHRWHIPPDFNIARAVCGRHASEEARVALLWEDETGETAQYTYQELQRQANRLSNVLAARGVGREDKIAIMLPQRPETAIAHIACYQLGAVAVPLSFLFGADALEYRLANSDAKVALVDPASLPNLAPIRNKLPLLAHILGVAGARESWTEDWNAALAMASDRFDAVATRATDPALLIYTSGTTGPPKGALMPQQCLLGNLPGFVYSHDIFPQDDDLFWSPADWAWTGGLMDALLPTLYFGRPIVAYQGRFAPEKAFELMQKYRVTHTFLFPTALKAMMKAVPAPRERYRLTLRAIMSAGEAADSWCRTGDTAAMDEDGYLWYQGRSDDVFKAAGYRIGPSEIENCLVKHPAVANAAVVPKPDAERGALVKAYVVLAPGFSASSELVADLQAHVRGKLAPYEYPKEIEFIDALPMTTTGKVQRRVLRLREEEKAKAPRSA